MELLNICVPVILSDHGIVFSGQLLDFDGPGRSLPTQDALGYPKPTLRETEAQRGSAQRDLSTGNLPLTRFWAKRNRKKGDGPASIPSRKYSEYRRRELVSFPWFAWLEIAI